MQDWKDQKDLIIYRLDSIGESLRHLDEKQDQLLERQTQQGERISVMEIKSGLFGTLGGIIGFFLTYWLESIKHTFQK
jgi:hypothetical protein